MPNEEVYPQIKEMVKNKATRWYNTVEGLELADLKVNVFLAAAMGMKNARELIAFFGMRAIERSLGTSFGFLIQNIATAVSGGEKILHDEGGDLKFSRAGTEWRIEIESGPACANMKMMRSTSEAQLRVKRRRPKIRVGLGLTYGKPKDLFSIMKDYYEGDQIFVGKEFWEHLTGDEDAYKKVLNAIKDGVEKASREAQRQLRLGGGREGHLPLWDLIHLPLWDLIQRKLEELTQEWIAKHGESLEYDDIVTTYF